MKLKVCFKDNYPCRAETCGEYNVCKIRLAKEKQTNEEWFNDLSTETKARIMHLVYIAGYTDGFRGAETIPLRDVMEWLKQPHRD